MFEPRYKWTLNVTKTTDKASMKHIIKASWWIVSTTQIHRH